MSLNKKREILIFGLPQSLHHFLRYLYKSQIQAIAFLFLEIKDHIEISTKQHVYMATTKSAQAQPKAASGKGSLNEAKTNEDFNKETPKKDDQQLKVKKVKK